MQCVGSVCGVYNRGMYVYIGSEHYVSYTRHAIYLLHVPCDMYVIR